MEDIIRTVRHLHERVERIEKEVELLKKFPDVLSTDWMDGQDVLLALHISRRTLQTLRDSGKLIPTRLLRKYYYKASDIRQILAENYIRYHIPTKHHD